MSAENVYIKMSAVPRSIVPIDLARRLKEQNVYIKMSAENVYIKMSAVPRCIVPIDLAGRANKCWQDSHPTIGATRCMSVFVADFQSCQHGDNFISVSTFIRKTNRYQCQWCVKEKRSYAKEFDLTSCQHEI